MVPKDALEKISFTGDFPKMNIQTFAAEFVYEIDGRRSYKKAYRNFIVPELLSRFGPVFPISQGWMHLYRNVNLPRSEYGFLVKRGDEEIQFQNSPKDWKKQELSIRLYDENLPKLKEVLAQPMRFVKVGLLQEEKRLDVIALKIAKRQCLLKRNKAVIKGALLGRINDPNCKRKRLEELCEDLAWGDVSVMPEIFCQTPCDFLESREVVSFELLERLYNVVERCVKELEDSGQIRRKRKSYCIKEK